MGEESDVSGRREAEAEAETDIAPGEDMEAGEEPLGGEEKMKGRPTKMSLRCRQSLRWTFERKRGEEGDGFCDSGGSVDHQACRLSQMSTMRSK